MRLIHLKRLVLLSVLLASAVAEQHATAATPLSITGIQFQPESSATGWQGTNWVSGGNYSGSGLWVAGQFPFNGNPSTYLRGYLSQNDGCYLLVTDTSGNLVSSRYTTFTGAALNWQQQFLGPTPNVFNGQALSVLCFVENTAQISLAWQASP